MPWRRRLRPRDATGARLVLDHELLAEAPAQVLRENARHDVRVAAGRERNDHRDGPRRPLALRRAGTGQHSRASTTVTASLTRMRDGTCFLQPLSAIEARVFRHLFSLRLCRTQARGPQAVEWPRLLLRRSRWLVLSGLPGEPDDLRDAIVRPGSGAPFRCVRVACVKATRQGHSPTDADDPERTSRPATGPTV